MNKLSVLFNKKLLQSLFTMYAGKARYLAEHTVVYET